MMAFIPLQPEKAELSMAVRVEGREKVTAPGMLAKAEVPMVVMPSSRTTVSRAVQPLPNSVLPMETTLPGKVMDFRLGQFWKAKPPTVSRVEGREKVVTAGLSRKAYWLISVMPSASVTEIRLSQYASR